QRNIQEVQFQAQKTVKDASGAWIEDLANRKPDYQQERDKKRRLECRDILSASACGKERDVHKYDQEILRKVNSHIVSKVFTYEVFEEEPAEKNVEALAPVVQNLDGKGQCGKTNGH